MLYAGVGTGEELESAVAAGMRATALDSSAAMLERARQRLGAARNQVHFLCENIFDHRPNRPYDIVVANFFLNVFSPSVMPSVLGRLSDFLGSDGVLVIGDFAPPAPHWFEQLLQRTYYLLPLAIFWLLTDNAWHPLYDYRLTARRCGLLLTGFDRVRVFRHGPSWLCTLKFSKVGHDCQ